MMQIKSHLRDLYRTKHAGMSRKGMLRLDMNAALPDGFIDNDHYGKLAVGNVHEVSIREAWTSLMEPLRRLHKEGLSHEAQACAECPMRMNEIKKRGEA
jgi:MoaA/NifB/PqqE/SkfB family radical SAM enzyme